LLTVQLPDEGRRILLFGNQAGVYGLLKSRKLADIVVLPLAGEADFIGSLGQAFP